jgi:FMN phosphatase YigB (HAD superfamily)
METNLQRWQMPIVREVPGDWAEARLRKALTGVSVLANDLYKTMARTPFKEPIKNLFDIMQLEGRVPEDNFLVTCLSTPYHNTDRYLDALTEQFELPKVGKTVRDEFRTLVNHEMDGLLAFTDVEPNLLRLKKHYRLSVVTNSWPFPVTIFLVEGRLRPLFDDVLCSAEVGVTKQDGPEIYRIGAVRVNVRPEQICMIGDNPFLDYLHSIQAGSKAIMCDRYHEVVDEDGNWKVDAIKENHHKTLAEKPELLDQLLAIEEPAVIRNYRELPDPIQE